MSAPVIPIRRGPPSMGDWRDRIDYKQSRRGDREILNTLSNCNTIIRNDEAWKGVLAWNELSQGIVSLREPPWYTDPRCIDDADGDYDPSRPWEEIDGWRVQCWLQRKWSLSVSAESAYRSALMAAMANRFDPLRAWLTGIEHDGLPRVDRWLHTYFGVEDTPYSRLVGRLFLIGAISRAMEPGCKFDTMLVLEGPQGKGKSEGVRRLFGDDYFRETPLDLHSNDRFLALRGCWCREWPELDGLGKADVNRVKSFISAREDDFRAPYDRGMSHQKRRCVLIATLNPPQLGYLTDETGNRRMLPVVCGVTGPIDFDAIVADRDQIWAEAFALYRAGAKCYAATDAERRLCNQEQEARMVAEVWEGKVEQWLAEPLRAKAGATITIRQVLTDCIGITLDKCDKSHATRVGLCLGRLGWSVAGQERTTGEDGKVKRERLYVKRSDAAPPPTPDDEERAAIGEQAAE